MSDVLTRMEGVAGCISLNRPRAIHALTSDMVQAMIATLLEWRDLAEMTVVMIDHAVDPAGAPKLSRGFCSGGDINLLRQSALNDGGVAGRRFFYEEYQLNHLLFTYPERTAGKTVVAFMDGITMGGGVGISQPAALRVATPNTRFAMPESGIGLFPDVGGGWYLSRLKGRLGQYLALTGARLDGAECLWAGLATHYLPVEVLPKAKAAIAAGEAPELVLDALSCAPPPAQLADHAEAIERLFASDHLETIIAALEADESDFARETLATIRSKSPTTCKVALRQLVLGAAMPDFAANMAMEYRIGARVLMLPDFAEGVRAVIVDKDNAPQWSPATPEAVSETTLDAIFAALPAQEEWKPV
ncbi:enoyl-CoA hydratase/isomerase family protein [Novosphingobium umbonatum]|uniref:3-hydroxyisobutyryl-CoA hydrolase n=1 Tax=Novosphingobium umbonatum TaxID=1908524 RepID=A0A437N796_9SPHN|nr:enoyl-CoA hydratase/isomerase family protein [Novosphingobium umbonatum]RVU05761.1 enoyl-CoA hydratase/isomerase family protein [Novosphingobium umbonatum]